MATSKSCILWKNETNDVFLVDIPTSISLGQSFSQSDPGEGQGQTQTQTRARTLLSTPPQKEAYPAPPEPKTSKARVKVLQGVPVAERGFHEDVIGPLAQGGLDVIRRQWDGEWCLPRVGVESGPQDMATVSASVRDQSQSRSQGIDLQGGSLDQGQNDPPVILSSTSENIFTSMDELRGVTVRNPSMGGAVLIPVPGAGAGPVAEADPSSVEEAEAGGKFTIPPLSTFVLSTIPPTGVIPGLPSTCKFNLVLLDPPWPNRSVRRSGHYHTQSYTDMAALTHMMQRILQTYLVPPTTATAVDQGMHRKRRVAAIWLTNSYKARMAAYDAIHASGLVVAEEWAWVKTAVNGEAVLPVFGVWRKPYEILVIGSPSMPESGPELGQVKRRVIAAVPDIHSRKPNLKELFEEVFFQHQPQPTPQPTPKYTALEVFARNLTSGWWAVGDEVLRFNSDKWWTS